MPARPGGCHRPRQAQSGLDISEVGARGRVEALELQVALGSVLDESVLSEADDAQQVLAGEAGLELLHRRSLLVLGLRRAGTAVGGYDQGLARGVIGQLQSCQRQHHGGDEEEANGQGGPALALWKRCRPTPPDQHHRRDGDDEDGNPRGARQLNGHGGKPATRGKGLPAAL